ncbi:acetylornithine deacetylase [Conexibacter woesei]|uniref:acetylornithine deacetylase n=1 Tax=Conexibacter woesei TaxID=191495 RepID=UPI0004251472|nr:acetylornithine deacetylase [Conexibacter woesei]
MAPDRGAVALLARLVACRSIAGGGNGELIAEVAHVLEGAGAVVHVLDGTRSGVSVLHAVLGPADAAGGLLLAAHGDVVDVAGQRWTSDPFSLCESDGRLHGRGATDMKGFLAAALAAVRASDPSALRAPLHLALSHDEELGCAGIGPLLDALGDNLLPAPLAGVVVGEPTALRVVDRHKGKAALDITVRGRAAHSATPAAGVNAVVATAQLVGQLEALGSELAGEATDAAFSVPHATIGIGPIAGGVAVNIVPDTCTLKVETRVLPGQPLDGIVGRIEAVAAALETELQARAPEAVVAVRQVAGYPALAPDPAGAAFAAHVGTVAGRGSGGAVDFGTEAGLYQQRLGVPVVVCGPGSMAQGHTPDEYLTVAELTAGEAFVAGLIARLRG